MRNEQWDLVYEYGIEFIEDRDGISWHNARRPWKVHRCQVQTNAYLGGRQIERCRCGAERIDGSRGKWKRKNMRRRVGI